jgi:hypothetical protein
VYKYTVLNQKLIKEVCTHSKHSLSFLSLYSHLHYCNTNILSFLQFNISNYTINRLVQSIRNALNGLSNNQGVTLKNNVSKANNLHLLNCKQSSSSFSNQRDCTQKSPIKPYISIIIYLYIWGEWRSPSYTLDSIKYLIVPCMDVGYNNLSNLNSNLSRI